MPSVRRSRVVVVVVAAAFVVTVASRAKATTNFPVAIQTDLALGSAPACALCHTTGNSGGFGTVNTPFGTNARAHGLVAFDEAKLKAALDSMATDHTDSDADCVDDIDELKQGTDPNTANAAVGCDAGPGSPSSASATSERPRYGCGAQMAAGAIGGLGEGEKGASDLLAASILGLVVRRRRTSTAAPRVEPGLARRPPG